MVQNATRECGESDGGHLDEGGQGSPGFQGGTAFEERPIGYTTMAIHEGCILMEKLRDAMDEAELPEEDVRALSC